MANYGKKKSLKDHFSVAGKKTKNFLRKAFIATLAAGAIGGAGYYEYGTMQEQDVKVVDFRNDTNWDTDAGKMVGTYTFYTDKGNFIAEPSRFHLQSQDDVNDIYNKINRDNTYHLKTYGKHIAGNWQPNILEVRQVTDQELKARAAAAEKSKKAAGQQPQAQSPQIQQGAIPVVQGAQPVGAMSGEVVTYPVVVGNYRVQVTIPAEVVGRVTINNVTPLVVAPPAPAPVPVQQYAPPPAPSPYRAAPAAPAPTYDDYGQ